MSMMSEIAAPERRLKRWLRLVREGLPSAGRYQRYIRAIAPVFAAIWLLTGAYLVLTPKTYTSQFVLILPGSGAGSSINVESIGQAQASMTSAFASPTLSPTENYKQLLTADVTLDAAARLAHDKSGKFPQPMIKLVDQTDLITVIITGPTAAKAQLRAESLRRAFMAELDSLRTDEAEHREESDTRHLADLADKVKSAQAKLIAFQAAHGLATLEQFNARITAADALRDKERDLRLQFDEQRGTSNQLSGILGDDPRMANVLMRLRGDPVFSELVHRYAVSNADAEQKAGTLGPHHAAMAQNNAERSQLLDALLARGHAISSLSDDVLIRIADMELSDGRNNLMQAMSESDAQSHGTARALRDLRDDMAQARAMAPQWIALAQQLADLQRDQRVTEAVFSSAMARLQTNRQDPFASYPLVQVLSPPTLPKKPSSPSLIIGLVGAVAASILALIGFGLAWLRQPLLDRVARRPGTISFPLSRAELARAGLGSAATRPADPTAPPRPPRRPTSSKRKVEPSP